MYDIKKYLVKIPLQWYGKFFILKSDKVKIYHTYLSDGIKYSSARATLRYNNLGIADLQYHYVRPINPINPEKTFEIPISNFEYQQKLENNDKTKKRIVKSKYYFQFNKQDFELDIFEDQLTGLSILEIDLDDVDGEILLPPFLKVAKEITYDIKYFNHNLSILRSYHFEG